MADSRDAHLIKAGDELAKAGHKNEPGSGRSSHMAEARSDHPNEKTDAKDDSKSDAKSGHAGDKLVSAEPGSAAYAKTGGSQAVDSQQIRSPHYPGYAESAHEANLGNRVSETDPNWLEAKRNKDGLDSQSRAEAADRKAD